MARFLPPITFLVKTHNFISQKHEIIESQNGLGWKGS